MVDIEKILEKELKENIENGSNKTVKDGKIVNNKKEKNEKEVHDKIEHFVVNKKIKIIKQLLKEKVFLITVSFSLIILILATAFYLVYFNSLDYIIKNSFKKNKEEITTGLNSNITNTANHENTVAEISNKNFSKNDNSYNKSFVLDEEMVYNENSNNLNHTYKNYGYEQKIKELKEIINKECPKINVSCLANLAYRYKNPSFCLFSNSKGLCLQKYKEMLTPLNYAKAEEIINELINGSISKEELEKRGISLEELASITGDTRICSFLKDPEQFSFCN